MKVLYLGHYKEGTGWSQAALDLILALDSAGVDVACRNIKLTERTGEGLPERVLELESKPVENTDVCIQHLLPHHLVGTDCFKKNISYLVSESTSLKMTPWFPYLQQMDEVWTANTQLQQSLLSDGLFDSDERVKVVPHAFDLTKYNKDYNKISIQGVDHKFKFYFIGDLNDRKNISSVIRSFHSEFDSVEPVSLIIKVKKHGLSPEELKNVTREMCNSIKSRLRMYSSIEDYHTEIIISDTMDDDGINSLHQYGDCFDCPSHGEGWSIPSFDAMCFGNTPICSDFGGPQEFIGDVDTGTLVDGCYCVCDTTDSVFPQLLTGREDWFHPSEASIKKAMRYYYENWSKVDRPAGLKHASKFSYESVGNMMKDYLGE